MLNRRCKQVHPLLAPNQRRNTFFLWTVSIHRFPPGGELFTTFSCAPKLSGEWGREIQIFDQHCSLRRRDVVALATVCYIAVKLSNQNDFDAAVSTFLLKRRGARAYRKTLERGSPVSLVGTGRRFLFIFLPSLELGIVKSRRLYRCIARFSCIYAHTTPPVAYYPRESALYLIPKHVLLVVVEREKFVPIQSID